jgi:hypothetical protein
LTYRQTLVSSLGDKQFKRVKVSHGATDILMDLKGNPAFIVVRAWQLRRCTQLGVKTLSDTDHISVGGERSTTLTRVAPII